MITMSLFATRVEDGSGFPFGRDGSVSNLTAFRFTGDQPSLARERLEFGTQSVRAGIKRRSSGLSF